MSNNLQTDRITGLTSGKEVVIDDALEAMDAAITEQEDIDFTGGIDITLTDMQWLQNFQLNLINAGVSGLDLTLPALKKVMVIRHKSGANAVNLKVGSTNASLAPGGSYIVFTDGTANGLVAQQITTSSPYFSSLVTVTADTTLTAIDHEGKFIKGNKATDFTLTIDKDADSAWNDDAEMEGVQYGVGQVLFAVETGDLRVPPGLIAKTVGQYAPWSLKRIGTNEWLLAGQLST